MKIGYAKIGRSILLNPRKWGAVGGDNEPLYLLDRLARRNPQHEFVIIGRNSGEHPKDVGLPDNVTNPWTGVKLEKYGGAEHDTREGMQRKGDELYSHIRGLDLDDFVLWSGQHGTSNMPIPKTDQTWDGELTKPQMSFIQYVGFLLRAVNDWRDEVDGAREEIWLNADVRNYIKCRDLKWPLRNPVLAQFNEWRKTRHERFKDNRSPSELGFEGEWYGPTSWESPHRSVYSYLELVGIPDVEPNLDWADRIPFGMIVNENRTYVARDRRTILQNWILPAQPSFIHGKWSDKTQEEIGMQINPIPHGEMFDKIRTARCTLTTPASGSGWATTKPWESFASGVVCFFHPDYDTQGHIIPVSPEDAEDEDMRVLTEWLRVNSPEQFKRRVEYLSTSAGRSAWEWIVEKQLSYFRETRDRRDLERTLEERWT